MPPQLERQHAVLLLHMKMTILPAPLCDSMQRAAQPRRGGFLLHHPVPTPRLRPVVGEAEQVECLRPPATTLFGRHVVGSSKLDQPSLRGVQLEAILRESLR